MKEECENARVLESEEEKMHQAMMSELKFIEQTMADWTITAISDDHNLTDG